MEIKSSSFQHEAMIPAQYTCDGRNISPPLSWNGAPEKTKSFALICDDPDAPVGDWVHWVLFNLPPDTRKLEEGVPAASRLSSGAVQGLNDYNRSGYAGPWPPPGRPHRYVFKVFALDTMLDLDARARKADLLRAMEGHILARGQLVGAFGR